MHVDFAFDKSTRQKYRICGILRPADARTHVPERENRFFFRKARSVTISHGCTP